MPQSILGRAKSAFERTAVKLIHRKLDRAKTDSRIVYPCYMPFDQFIDVERLKSLDAELTERISQRLPRTKDEKFHTGALTLRPDGARLPGSQIIWLSRNAKRARFNYLDLDKPDFWEPTRDAAEFDSLMQFIATLPFKQTARMIIMYDASGHAVTAHRDHYLTGTIHEFIWFRTNLDKPFYMLNHKTGQRRYVESYSCWFDVCNQFHGVDPKPGLSISIRVDGIFSDELRAKIPRPAYNLASTPSLWACIGHRANQG